MRILHIGYHLAYFNFTSFANKKKMEEKCVKRRIIKVTRTRHGHGGGGAARTTSNAPPTPEFLRNQQPTDEFVRILRKSDTVAKPHIIAKNATAVTTTGTGPIKLLMRLGRSVADSDAKIGTANLIKLLMILG